MKLKLFTTTAALALFGLASTSALFAADEPNGERPSREEMIKRFDANNDGKLDQDERAAMRAAAPDRPAAAQADRSGGGRGERAERGGQRGERGQGGPGGQRGPGGPGGADRLKQFDTDGDGKLSESERAAADSSMRATISSNPRAMERIDTDGDGKISDTEWAAGRKAMEDQRGGQRGPRGGQGGGRERSN